MRRMKPFVVSLENDSSQTPAGDGVLANAGALPVPPMDVASDAPDVEELRLDEAEGQADILAVQAEDGSEVITALESLQELLLESGDRGVSAQTARAVNIATEALFDRVEMSLPATVSMESFNPTTPASYSKIALENIAEGAAKVWAAIVAALRKAAVWLKQFFRTLFDFSPRVKKQAEDLKKQVASLSGKPSHEEFRSTTIFHSLQVMGKFPHSVSAEAHTTQNLLERQFERIKLDALQDADIVAKFSESFENYTYDPEVKKHASGLKLNAGNDHFTTPPLLGGMVIAQKLWPATTTGLAAVMAQTDTPRLDQYSSGGARYKTLIDIGNDPTLTCGVGEVGEMQACLTSAASMADSVTKFRETAHQLETLADKFLAEAESYSRRNDEIFSASKKTRGETSSEKRESVMGPVFQRRFLASAPRWLVQEPISFANYQLRTAKALIAYVKRSASFYPQAQKAEVV